jgi:hypothetical protein
MMTSVYATTQPGVPTIAQQPMPTGFGQTPQPQAQQPYGMQQLGQFGLSGGHPHAIGQVVIDSALRIAAIATSTVVEQLSRDPQMVLVAGQLPPQAWSQLLAECARRVTPIVAGIPGLVQAVSGIQAPLALGYWQQSPYLQQSVPPQLPIGQQFGGMLTQPQHPYAQQHAVQAQLPYAQQLFGGVQPILPIGQQFGWHSPYFQQPLGAFSG